MRKFLIILQASAAEYSGWARALHSLLYAKELKRAGHEIVLLFDGSGTEWARALQNPAHEHHVHYEAVKKMGVVEAVCEVCAGVFKVDGDLRLMGYKCFASENEGHAGLAKWVEQGFEIITL